MGAGSSVYPHLPLALQHAAISAYGYRWRNRRYGGVFERELRAFKEREGYTAERWREYQTLQLRRLLVHAWETVPYYRDRYGAAGLDVTSLGRFELQDLKRLPFLEKEDLRRFGRTELLSRTREPGGQFFASSGTSGTPTSILYSRPFQQRWSAAFEARVRHWAGVDRHTPRGMIGGRRIIPAAVSSPPYHRYNIFERQTYLSAYHISRSTAASYLESIRHGRVEYMTGYAMSNYFLATMCHELSLKAPQLRAVITSSEALTLQMRDVFRLVYGCRTFDTYSGVEACGLITENEAGELAVSPDAGIIELLDANGRETGPGTSGELVSTGLLNFDQPLIRYRIGDRATLAADQSSRSGREMPLIAGIEGRLEDKVVGPDGREMVRFHGLFVDIEHLVAAQIVQEAVDAITVRVVADQGFSAAQEATIAQRLRSQLGDVKVSVERVDRLPVNANGKVKAVISKLIKG